MLMNPPLRIQVSYRCTFLVVCGIDIVIIIVVIIITIDHIINFRIS
jgi:hypothetical protein